MSKSLINSIQLLEIENDYLRNKLKKLEAELKQSKVMVVKPEEIVEEDFPSQVFYLEKSGLECIYNIFDADGSRKEIITADTEEEAIAKFKEYSSNYSETKRYVISCSREEGISYSLSMVKNAKEKYFVIYANNKLVDMINYDESTTNVEVVIDIFNKKVEEIKAQKNIEKPKVISTAQVI